jgi:hypothetical protein
MQWIKNKFISNKDEMLGHALTLLMHIITCLVGKAQMSSRSLLLRIDEVVYMYNLNGQTCGKWQ